MDCYAHFPSLVYRVEKPDWVKQTLEATQKYYSNAQNNSPIAQTEQMANDPALKFLGEYLSASAYEILRQQGYDMQKYEIYVAGLWGQGITNQGGTNVHVHKNSQMCGWFFLETTEGGAYPIYQDTRMNKQMVELDYVQGQELTNASSQVHFNDVVPGTILLSNSWVPHQLVQNRVEAQAKALHFTICHREKLCSTY